MLVDYREISAEALENLCKEYVIANLSEVEQEVQLEDWVAKTIELVKSGELVIEFSEQEESISLKNESEINWKE
ncbi:MAG: YheU family protein [Kangiellaceae bacterium]|nr:YheU family protein [Kangiellaceae bacterium]MCW8998156.1 YheU family protein [Kangiellaceae bacterium]